MNFQDGTHRQTRQHYFATQKCDHRNHQHVQLGNHWRLLPKSSKSQLNHPTPYFFSNKLERLVYLGSK